MAWQCWSTVDARMSQQDLLGRDSHDNIVTCISSHQIYKFQGLYHLTQESKLGLWHSLRLQLWGLHLAEVFSEPRKELGACLISKPQIVRDQANFSSRLSHKRSKGPGCSLLKPFFQRKEHPFLCGILTLNRVTWKLSVSYFTNTIIRKSRSQRPSPGRIVVGLQRKTMLAL